MAVLSKYEDERLYYDRKKHPERKQDTPFERVFFVLFADTGKLILQSRMFVDIPLNMTIVERLFRETLTTVLQRCEIGYVLSFNLPELEVSHEQFIEEFRQSTRVVQLSVIDPDPDEIPEDFVYYNPQRERNAIIRASHKHDYPNFQTVSLEASPDGDIKSTHIGSDLVVASEPQVMRYFIHEEERILRREVPARFEFRVDMDAVELSEEQLKSVLQILYRESALDLDIPTSARSGSVQEHFFDKLHGAYNGEN